MSFALGAYKFTIDEKYLEYRSAYGKNFRAPINDIDTASIDTMGWGKSILKITGRGSTLASIKLPQQRTKKAQDFVLNHLIKCEA